MAEKQFARSETMDLSTFADDDPLSELARIVTHDHRPAVEQLKELERHRQSMRFDPVVDLEEELLREFDAYDAPAAVPAVTVEPSRVAQAAVPPAASHRVEPQLAEVQPAAAPGPETLPLHGGVAPAPVAASSAATTQPIATYDTAFDLERELTSSMEAAPSAPVVAAPVAAAAPLPVAKAPVVEAAAAPEAAAPAPAAVVTPSPVRQANQGEPSRRAAYPFTPNFSRATPVAGGAQGQGRTFATPLPQTPPAPVVIAAPVAAEPIEPDFDLEAFELDLAEAAMEIDRVEVAPFSASPAYDTVATPIAAAPIDFDDLPEIELPFDPAMISESDEAPPAAADFDVPQLPVIEESRPVRDQGDYDLDIDAEMAHLFAEEEQATRTQPVEARPAYAAPAAAPVAAARVAAPASAYAPLPEVDDFEQVMNVDFRRSLSQRRETLAAGEIPEPRALYADDEPERSGGRRRLMLLASAAIVVLVAGGAAALTYFGGAETPFSSGEPQIILADKSPTKMVPVDKGGKTVPNQDKAVYDRVAGAAQEAPQQGSLVSSTEEPIDVVQRTLTPESLPLDRGEDGDELAMATPVEEDGDRLLPEDGGVSVAEEDAKPAVEPRKVRTMIVKPDGTLVAREETEQAPPISTVKATALKTSEPATDVTTATTRPVAQANAETLGALEAAASATARVASPAATRQPVPAAKPVQVAKAAPAVVDTFATPAPTATDAPSAAAPAAKALPYGSYVVQIASLPTEADAKASSAKMASKFGSVIGGRAMDIKQAEIAGKGTYYRVRVQGGSRDEANALCAKLKSAGGSCLVTK